MPPRPGDTVVVGQAASVQFGPGRALVMRLVKIGPPVTADGFGWIEGYVLNQQGNATERREVFVRLAGLRPAPQRRRDAAA